MSYRHVFALVTVGALLLTACGSRVTEEQRAFVIEGMAGGAGEGDVVPGAPDDAGGQGEDTDLALPEVAPGDDATTPDTTAGTGSAPGSGSQRPGNGGQAPGNGQQQTTQGQQRDTRAAPPGGNGGATDVGVTEDRIVIANVADISGAVPGLFEDAQKGAAAAIAHFTGTEGTVYGRRLEFLPLDSRLDSGQARQQYLRACEQAFGAAGSMSAFEEGAVDPVRNCGIPDMRAVATSRPMQQVDNVFGGEVQSVGQIIGTPWRYWQEQHPEAVKRSAYLWIENETTRFQTRQNIAATETIGYEWLIDQPIQVAETNYAGFVLDMKRQNVDFVTFQGDYTQAVRLARVMREQNFWPAVFGLQPNVYTPRFLEQGGSAVEGTQIYMSTTPVEEIGNNPEMQTYRQWLKQIDPQAEPTYLGMYGWSVTRLFIQGLKEIGPEVTRPRMIEWLRTVEGYDGNGLHAAQDIGPKRVSDCTVIVEVRNNQFVRVEPSSGFRCTGQPLRAPS